MARLVAVGECMVELSPAGGGLLRPAFAGDAFNVAWYARQLLPASVEVAFLSAVGDDPLSDRMLAFMEGEGVRTSLVGRRPGRTVGLYLIETREGERSFAYWRGESAARSLDRELPRLAAPGRGDALLATGITLAILSPEGRAALTGRMAAARAAGALVAFDPNIRPRLWPEAGEMRGAIAAAAGAASLVLPSLDDERAAFGDRDAEATAARYLGLGAGLVVVKDGPRPVLVARPGGAAWVPPAPVGRVVDSTAAGDSFDAGVISALLMGAAPEDAARRGARLAARVVGAPGALVRGAAQG